MKFEHDYEVAVSEESNWSPHMPKRAMTIAYISEQAVRRDLKGTRVIVTHTKSTELPF